MTVRLFFSLCLLALLVGCGSSEPPAADRSETAAAAPGETPTKGGSGATTASEPAGDTSAAGKPAADRPATPSGSATQPEAGPAETSTKDTTPADITPNPGLMDPAQAVETAPEEFRARFETTKGDFIVKVYRAWAPRGADRFYNLVRIGFFNDIAFFRVIKQPQPFMAQFGISGDPSIARVWDKARIPDDPVKQSNLRGRITFATAGPNTRTTQFFINFADNSNLDSSGFAPFGEVVEGMDVVDSLYAGYGEGAPRGLGPSQGLIMRYGNTYLQQQFERLDYIKQATLIE